MSWYEENGVELRTGTNVMSLDVEARTAKLQGGEGVEFGQALIDNGANVNIPRVGGVEPRPYSLPADVRQLGQHPRRCGEGGSGRAGGGQLHRLRGGGVAEVEGHRLRDRDDGGGCPLADLRRGGGAVVPRAARVEGDRDPRRRDAGGFRGR